MDTCGGEGERLRSWLTMWWTQFVTLGGMPTYHWAVQAPIVCSYPDIPSYYFTIILFPFPKHVCLAHLLLFVFKIMIDQPKPHTCHPCCFREYSGTEHVYCSIAITSTHLHSYSQTAKPKLPHSTLAAHPPPLQGPGSYWPTFSPYRFHSSASQ